MIKCFITSKSITDYSKDLGSISYSVLINKRKFSFIFEPREDWDLFLTEEAKHALHSWAWNDEWPFEEGVMITQALVDRCLRQVSYPKDFYSRLDYFVLKFSQSGGDKYEKREFKTKDFLCAFALNEEEFSRIILAAKDNNWVEEINERKLSSDQGRTLQLVRAGIKRARELAASQGLDALFEEHRPLTNKSIYLVYVEEDKEWGKKISDLMMSRGASIHSMSDGIRKDHDSFLLSSKQSIESSDFVLCIKSANSDKRRVWGDVLASLAYKEESFLKGHQFFYVLFIDDSSYDEYQHLRFRMGHLIDIRIKPRLNNLFLFIAALIAQRNPNKFSPPPKISEKSKPYIETDIAKIHNKVFDFLNEWNKNNSEERNRFFYLRIREDERFHKGYWFPGDEDYLVISFWSGGDALNKTPNIYISIHLKKGIEAYLIARDSDNKKKYFEKNLLPELAGYEVQGKKKDYWKKVLSKSMSENFLDLLKDFIDNDKKIIDSILETTLANINEPDFILLQDEFSSKFGFLGEEQFFELKSRVEAEKSKIQAEKLFDIEPALPFSISSIDIEKFHGIERTGIEELPANAKWIFLTGENGFGKTIILRAITLGLTNYDENRDYITEKTNIQILFNDHGDVVKNASLNAFGSGFRSLNNNFIAYGPNRLNVQASSAENQESRNSSNVYGLFNGDGLLKNVNYLIKMSTLKKGKEFDNLKGAIISILNNRIIDITLDESGEIQYHESDVNGDSLGITKWENLATGFKGLMNIVGDIIARFSRVFPDQNHSDYEGIVIIDELENHLHPIFQKKTPALLSKIFPKIQFIASVHSPIPLLGAPKESVIIKINRDQDQMITMERIVIDNVETLNPNILLTSPIFGFSSIISDNLIDKSKLRTDNSWDEMLQSEGLDKELLDLYEARKNTK